MNKDVLQYHFSLVFIVFSVYKEDVSMKCECFIFYMSVGWSAEIVVGGCNYRCKWQKKTYI